MVGVAPQRAAPVHQLGAQHCDVPRCLARRQERLLIAVAVSRHFAYWKRKKWEIFNHFSVAIWFCCDFPLMTHHLCSCDARFFGAPQDPCRVFQGIITIYNEYREYERKHLEPVKRSTASCKAIWVFPAGMDLLHATFSSVFMTRRTLPGTNQSEAFWRWLPDAKKTDIEQNLSGP